MNKTVKKEIIKSADTVEEATALAMEEAGMHPDEVTVTVVEEGKKGLFGKVKEPATVKITFDEAPGKAAAAKRYLEEILSALDLKNVTLEMQEEDSTASFLLEGEGLGFLIGRRGETLDALQYLTSLAANRLSGDYLRVTIDSGAFRQKREETLKKLAQKISKTVLRTGRNSTLEPMNPYERRIIHAAVSEIEGVHSSSVGEEPYRKVVIMSDNPRKGGRFADGDRPASRGRRDNRGEMHKDRRKDGGQKKKYDKDYMPPKGVSNTPSTYDFEKEFLKDNGGGKLYSKIEYDD